MAGRLPTTSSNLATSRAGERGEAAATRRLPPRSMLHVPEPKVPRRASSHRYSYASLCYRQGRQRSLDRRSDEVFRAGGGALVPLMDRKNIRCDGKPDRRGWKRTRRSDSKVSAAYPERFVTFTNLGWERHNQPGYSNFRPMRLFGTNRQARAD